ncbi:SMI1/KNR4 family protein [Streptomyces lonegramiae]|uniref:SUKH superfamily protein n=1 Tax=Streptomyces lonegramiae TaxID=3075524 RepID=A0ABU2X8U9_9ACTN|nr:hypothetical protein [Streptomyces sp. DSM 41529]MDT0542346.1 hypothetical protein [Streptomyces sp. DSM 41529]
MDSTTELRALLDQTLTDPRPHCPLPGHGAGHVCLVRDGWDPALLEQVVLEVLPWTRQPVRRLVTAGVPTPAFGGPPTGAGDGEVVELRGWALNEHWLGYGLTAMADGPRGVIVVARRGDFPPGTGWPERLAVVTGWEGPRPSGADGAIDWAAAESVLGTALPGGYKEIVDLFGAGGFDGYLDLLVPGALGWDLVDWGVSTPKYAELYRPYPVYPAPGGVLIWGSSEQEVTFHWLTGADDPDDWPVLVLKDFNDWQRFDCGTGEFILRMLTDRKQPFSFPPAARVAAHWFEPC